MLVNSGCSISSIDSMFVWVNRVPIKSSPNPRTVLNADGSINGIVKNLAEVHLWVVDHKGVAHNKAIDLQVINLGGKHDIL